MTGFVPIGDYHQGQLANVAKHRGAIDAYGALTYLEPTFGLDISNTIGVTFNLPNEVTHYKTGDELHWEWAVTKKLESGLSFGPVGYIYQQLSNDSGSGALLGAFRGEVIAAGGTVGYDFKLGAIPVSTRLRYYHEFEAKNRLKGNAGFLSLSLPLWAPGSS